MQAVDPPRNQTKNAYQNASLSQLRRNNRRPPRTIHSRPLLRLRFNSRPLLHLPRKPKLSLIIRQPRLLSRHIIDPSLIRQELLALAKLRDDIHPGDGVAGSVNFVGDGDRGVV